MKNKTKNSTRAAVSRYDEKFERAMIRMPIGTRAMIADTDLSVNAFANDAIERQLKALEMFDFEDDIKSMTPPKEVDGKPVYNFVDERKHIKPGRWWHDVVFFWDDLELNDLFIRFMDEEEPGNNNYKDGCRIIFDIVDTSRIIFKLFICTVEISRFKAILTIQERQHHIQPFRGSAQSAICHNRAVANKLFSVHS